MFFGNKKQTEELTNAMLTHADILDHGMTKIANVIEDQTEEKTGCTCHKSEEKHDVLDPVQLNVISKDTFEEAAKQVFDA